MKNYKNGVIIFFFLLLTGCTSNDDINSVDLEDYETQIKVLKSENDSLKEQIQNLNGDYSVYLQQAYKTSRQIMKLIRERNMDYLKAEYNAEFEVSDDKIFFTSAKQII